MTEAFPNRPTSLADYLEILHRRIWIILIPVVLAPILTYVIANRQKPVYSASANVYINLTPALSQALGFFSQTAGDPERYFQTEATIARNPGLIASVAKSQHVSPGELGSSSVSPALSPTSYLHRPDRQPDRAATLANAYATAFTKFEPAQDAKTLRTAQTVLTNKIRSARARGAPTAELLAGGSQVGGGLLLCGATSRR